METQLKREIAIMKLVKHKNIVQMREVMKTQKNIYIVMELVTGGELFDKIVSNKKFSEDVARRYFQQLIDAVEYCHSKGVAHRDIKPENLLLDANDQLKVSDFGLSNLTKIGNTKQILKTSCGTPNYVAPEVLGDTGYDGCAADVWSCGVVLFVMLTGCLPFEDDNLQKLFDKIARADYHFPKDFPPLARDLVSKMLTVDVKKRITIPMIKKHPWFKIGYKNEDKKDDFPTKEQIAAQQDKPVLEKTSSIESTEGDFVEATQVKRRTRFYVKGRYSDVIQTVYNACKNQNANPVLKDSEIKCTIESSVGARKLTFCINFEIHSKNIIQIEMMRGQGDVLQFQNIFRVLREKLKPDIISPLPTTPVC